MSDLIQSVVDGKITKNTATTTSSEVKNTRGTTELGQDAFLQLLVCEMQHQDPLEPTTNTEWISQMATFSQLEELQALSKTTENSQIFSLVGKNVIVSTEDANGNKETKSGVVDFINMSGGKAQFSVNGALYSMDELYSVIDTDYLYDKNKPGVTEKVNFSFNGDEPEDLSFKVSMGEDIAKASDVAVLVGNAIIEPEYVVLSGNTVTVKKEILQELSEGTYQFSIVFDDANLTTVDDMITVNIYNSHPTVAEDAESEETAETVEAEDDLKETEQTDTEAGVNFNSEEEYQAFMEQYYAQEGAE